MLRVALTGGVATGKSLVRRRVAANGVPTIDADAIVHELFAAGSETTRDVASRFGQAVLARDGAVDRRALGAIVFGDEVERCALEAIVHPRVYRRISGWLSAQATLGVPWALAEIPLLYETGHEGDYDRVVVVACSPDEQVRRVVDRDRISEADARRRLAAQWPIEDKVRRATDVIDTSQGPDEAHRQVDALCARLAGVSPLR